MRSARLFPAAMFALAMLPAPPPQTPDSRSAANLLKAERPLRRDEIAVVLAAAREAISGRTCRLSYVPNGPGPEVLMGAAGRPRYLRTVSGYDYGSGAVGGNGNGNRSQSERSGHVEVITFIEYTGLTARKCDGTSLGDELVVEYQHKSVDDRWSATARTSTPHEMLKPLFDMLTGGMLVESGDRRQFADRVGRSFVAPWTPPADALPAAPLPAGVRQSLWIDVDSLLPLRWSIAFPASLERGTPALPDYGLSFTYEASVDLRPPDGVPAPDCLR